MQCQMKLIILIFLIIGPFFVAAGSGNNAPRSPIIVNLSISKIPIVNETTDLSCKVDSTSDAMNTSVEITLP